MNSTSRRRWLCRSKVFVGQQYSLLLKDYVFPSTVSIGLPLSLNLPFSFLCSGFSFSDPSSIVLNSPFCHVSVLQFICSSAKIHNFDIYFLKCVRHSSFTVCVLLSPAPALQNALAVLPAQRTLSVVTVCVCTSISASPQVTGVLQPLVKCSLKR